MAKSKPKAKTPAKAGASKSKKSFPKKTTAPAPAAAAVAVDYRRVAAAQLFPSPLNPRKPVADDAAAILALADSIVVQGLLEPLLVRPMKSATVDGEAFEIIAGERRWRAISLAIIDGRLNAAYPVQVGVRPATDAELVELAATENMARADMHPLDEALAIDAMRRYHKDDAEIARRLGLPERTFYRRAALLRLCEELRQDLREGKITQQMASVFSLGTPKAQNAYRKSLANGGEWLRGVENIKRHMIDNRMPENRALFPLEQYTGTFLVDPESGERYFEDVTEFTKLQGDAIKAKVAALKAAGKWAFVKKIESWQQGSWKKVAKGEKGAGAIWWLGAHDGSFHSRAPALDAEARNRNEVAKRTRDAAEEDADADERAARERLEAGLEAERSNLIAGALEEPRRAIAWMVCDALGQSGIRLPLNCEAALIAALSPVVADLRAASGVEADADASDLFAALEDTLLGEDEPATAKIYGALLTLPVKMLLRALVALNADAMGEALVSWHSGLTAAGALLLQRELPLAAAPSAEEAP